MVVVVPFDDEDEGVAIANDSDYGLYDYVFTGDTAPRDARGPPLRAGNIGINTVQRNPRRRSAASSRAGSAATAAASPCTRTANCRAWSGPADEEARTMTSERSGEGVVAPAAGPVAFDPFEDGFAGEWHYDQYRRLHEHDPVHWSELLCGWIITRYDDVAEVLHNRTMSSDLNQASSSTVVDLMRQRARTHEGGGSTVVLLDDPEHARIRKLMQAPFTVRNVERIHESIHRRVAAALESVEQLGSMELIGELAYPLPVSVFCEMLGIPDEAGPQFHAWTSAVARSLDLVLTDEEFDACIARIEEMEIYLGELADGRRSARPRTTS